VPGRPGTGCMAGAGGPCFGTWLCRGKGVPAGRWCGLLEALDRTLPGSQPEGGRPLRGCYATVRPHKGAAQPSARVLHFPLRGRCVSRERGARARCQAGQGPAVWQARAGRGLARGCAVGKACRQEDGAVFSKRSTAPYLAHNQRADALFEGATRPSAPTKALRSPLRGCSTFLYEDDAFRESGGRGRGTRPARDRLYGRRGRAVVWHVVVPWERRTGRMMVRSSRSARPHPTWLLPLDFQGGIYRRARVGEAAGKPCK